jgi:alpha-ketoglutarate-dependent taurine dioxygenase
VFIPPHFGAQESHAPARPLVEHRGTNHILHVRFDQLQVRDSAAFKAAAAFYSAMSMAMQRIRLEPGEMLIINNRHALHGRDGFAADNDGVCRDLRRVYIKSDIAAFGDQYDPNTRRVQGF